MSKTLKTIPIKVDIKPMIVWGNKKTGQCGVSIPMNSNIKIGDRVIISKVIDDGEINE